MRLGIMQPYLFPYVGYFSLIEASDRWIVFDTPQYIRHGWVNRNRVLKRGNGDWKYIRIPLVKAPQDTPICQMRIDDSQDWRGDVVRNLDYYHHCRAPHYRATVDFLNRALTVSSDKLSVVLTHLLRETCAYVGIQRVLDVFSEMNLNIGPVSHPGEWALRICESLGAKSYVNPPGGRDIFDVQQFAGSEIELRFLQPALPPYDQRRATFVPGLSLIDALMWNSRQHVLAMVREYSLVG
jgi:hypothetical protein